MLFPTIASWMRTQRQSFTQVRRSAATVAIIGFLAILALCVFLGFAQRSARLSIAASPLLLPRDGVYLVESFPENAGFYQWAADKSWFQIPNPGGPLLLRLELLSGPSGATPIVLHAGQATLHIVVTPNLRTYHMLLPESNGPGMWLAIDAPTVRVGQRDLGIAVSAISIAGGRSLPLSMVIICLAFNLIVSAVVRSRSLIVIIGLILIQGVALWWYLSSGWIYTGIGLTLAAVIATFLTAMILHPWWPTRSTQPSPDTGDHVLALAGMAGVLIIAISLWLLLIVDRQVIPLVIPCGLAIATVGSYAFVRQAGWSVSLAIIAVVIAQIVLLGIQSWLGWQSPLVALMTGIGGVLCLVAVIFERWLPPAIAISVRSIPWTRRDAWITGALIGVALCVRLIWMAAPDPVGDIELAARRMGLLQANGLAGAYSYGGDYMPLWLYTLYGMSYSVVPLGGQFFDPLPAITRAIVKSPSIVADLATAWLIYWWGRRWNSQRDAALIAALYTLSPPIWINPAWWGQADTLLMLPLVATLLLFDRADGRWSWLLWAIAQATKPQAIVLLPVLAVMTLRRYGCRGIVQGLGIALATFSVAALPLLAAGQAEELYHAIFTSAERFPIVTNGAYNVGYLLTGRARIHDTDLWLGVISYRLFGFCLLSGTTLLICLALLRRTDMLARFLAAATTALAFALLPTQIHERYLFLPLAFLVLCVCLDRSYLVLYVVLMVSATLNIFGDLSGFWPSAATFIRATPLPSILAIGNIIMLLVLLWRLITPAKANNLQIL